MIRHLLLASGLLFHASTVRADEKIDLTRLPPAATHTVDFTREIQPILVKNCVPCHGAAKQRGGLRLDDGVKALEGGNSGPAFKPKDAIHSRLLLAVSGLEAESRMPPEGKTPLSPAEVGLLRAWIDQGAKWPQSGGAAAAQGPQSSHWAFQPIRRPPPPVVPSLYDSWVRNEVDRFILARLLQDGLTPSPEASRTTLIRRLSLDLLGLPPTPAEVDAFLADPRPDAYEHLVARLLASPHYGERWGRHWLDAARYADSDGFEKDTGRPHAWRYRNWVIDALNRDLPYDRFVIEQLAGDLLPSATAEQKVATGFHRNTLTNREGGVDQEQYRVEQVVDRVNTTSRVFLGITLGCCQCHDHKYDPFSQRDYYSVFAFFNSDQEVDIPAPLADEEASYTRRKTEHDRKKAELDSAVAAYRKEKLSSAVAAWERSLSAEERKKLPANLLTILAVAPAKRNEAQTRELSLHYEKNDAKLIKLTREVASHQKAAPAPPLAQTLALGPTRKTHVHIRGDFLRPGAEVQPALPALLAPPTSAGAPRNRLDLARWIADPKNPLTARVAVNWAWQKFFGRGLVATPEDFGTQGELPSHPELLDALASDFLRSGGSLKQLHTKLVTSAVYRQSSSPRPELMARDASNRLLARQSRLRLEAEILRDVTLAASGLLVRRLGGPSVRPPQPAGISELTYAGSARWVESPGPDRYRRGLYTWFQRTSPYPMLMTFDAPDSNVCTVRRERSNTPLQALTMLNDLAFVECAQALGRRLVAEVPARSASEDVAADRLRQGYRLCVGREPTAAETDRLTRLAEELHALCREKPAEAAKLAGGAKVTGSEVSEVAAWVAVARVLLNLDELVTRE